MECQPALLGLLEREKVRNTERTLVRFLGSPGICIVTLRSLLLFASVFSVVKQTFLISRVRVTLALRHLKDF